jgi:hypothetical protein
MLRLRVRTRPGASLESGVVVHVERDIEALKAELASLEAMLADIESGKIPHGLSDPFEDCDRQTVIRRRIEKIKWTLGNAHRSS